MKIIATPSKGRASVLLNLTPESQKQLKAMMDNLNDEGYVALSPVELVEEVATTSTPASTSDPLAEAAEKAAAAKAAKAKKAAAVKAAKAKKAAEDAEAAKAAESTEDDDLDLDDASADDDLDLDDELEDDGDVDEAAALKAASLKLKGLFKKAVSAGKMTNDDVPAFVQKLSKGATLKMAGLTMPQLERGINHFETKVLK